MRWASDCVRGADALRVVEGRQRVSRSLAGHCGRNWGGGGMGESGGGRRMGVVGAVDGEGVSSWFWVCDIPWVTADCMRVRRGGLSAGGRIDDGGGGVVEINDEVADLVRDGDWWE